MEVDSVMLVEIRLCVLPSFLLTEYADDANIATKRI